MPRGGARKDSGRKPYIPTEKDRGMVKAMTACGISTEEIGQVLGVCERTVRRKFPRELATGHIEANARVAKSLYDQAVAGNVTAAIFWAKARMGWRDVQRTEVVGDNGGPVQVETAREMLAAKFEAIRAKSEPDAAQAGDSKPS